jgi:cysteine synthase A
VCSGWIGAGTTIVEASSGSTAVSEAYFAQLLELPFIAVMPAATTRRKVELIERSGGSCRLVEDPAASFMPRIVDRMLRVPDGASVAAMRFAAEHTGRSVGASTGTNLWGALQLVCELRAAGRRASVVTLICDGGDRYLDTYLDDDWVRAHQLDPEPYVETLERCLATGTWTEPDRISSAPASAPTAARPAPASTAWCNPST